MDRAWRRRGLLSIVAAAFLGALPGGPAWSAGEPPYKDASLPIEERVEDLLARMTLEEKLAQVTALWEGKSAVLDDALQVDPAKLRERFPHGIGQLARPSDAKGPLSPRELRGRDPRGTVAVVNAIQEHEVRGTRLGIPAIFHEESLHGYAAVGATSFPQAIALASSWDPALVREVNEVIAREVRARGVHLVLSPVVDVARDPRWGRIEETFGEDPFLVGEMGVAAVLGLQGQPDPAGPLPPGHVFATLKHMTGHGQPESGTNVGPAPISERELRETFFPPFAAAIARAGASVVMASYNEIDGVPSHVNRWLLGDVLRGELGFRGMVVGDYYAVEQLVDLHRVAASREEAAIRALQAGVDVDLPNGNAYGTLLEAVRGGRLPESALDNAVRRVLTLKLRAGLFEQPFADPEAVDALTHAADAVALARRAAQRSIVLLENDGVLPLALPSVRRGARRPVIAAIGPNMAVARLGGYSGEPPATVSLLEGLRARVGDRAQLRVAQGVKITQSDDWWADEVKLADTAENRRLIAEAVETARGADVILLALGDTEQTSREGWAGNHLGDRDSLDLVGE